jgi:hypothetical protein
MLNHESRSMEIKKLGPKTERQPKTVHSHVNRFQLCCRMGPRKSKIFCQSQEVVPLHRFSTYLQSMLFYRQALRFWVWSTQYENILFSNIQNYVLLLEVIQQQVHELKKLDSHPICRTHMTNLGLSKPRSNNCPHKCSKIRIILLSSFS